MRAPAEALPLVDHAWPALDIQTPADLEALFTGLRSHLREETAELRDEEAVRRCRDRWQARKTGLLTRLRENWLTPAPPDWKKPLGQGLNQLRAEVESALAAADEALRRGQLERRLEAERVDISLPGRRRLPGPEHPVLQTMAAMVEIFVRLGYSIAEGPEIETAYYNFEALNIPEGHPAREEQDTLYLGPALPGHLLRTHTSPVQIRAMERMQPPLRLVAPGKVYRRDDPDATHSPMFHQVEGLAVDTDLHLGDLKGTLAHFAQHFFGSSVETRFRPSFFPFTEPSAEMDISCLFCSRRGCRVCKQSGWIEVLGCGMVDPAVFAAVHYDPERYTGFAFGMGVERFAMLRYGVDDMQRFYSGDLRFLEQFRR